MAKLICEEFKMVVSANLSDLEYDKEWNKRADYIKSLVLKHSLTLGQRDALFGLMVDGKTHIITEFRMKQLKEALIQEGYKCHIE